MSYSSSRGRCRRYLLDDIMYVTNEVGEKKCLGRGGEGLVYLADIYLGFTMEKIRVAVKHLKPDTRVFEQEIETVSKIQHPHLVSLLGYCQESGQKLLIYEYMENGSLSAYVKMDCAVSLSWLHWLNICLGVARGLQYLHAKTDEYPTGIIHRDVKPDNILLNKDWIAKVSDFGAFKVSNASQPNSDKTTKLIGTSGYCAPEYLQSHRATRKLDIYSFGVVLFQVLCRKMPWERPAQDDTYVIEEDGNLALWAQQNVDTKLKAEISDDSLKEFTAIIGKSLQANPSRRPTIDDVVKDLEMILLRLQNVADVLKPNKSETLDEDLQNAAQEFNSYKSESLKLQNIAPEFMPHTWDMPSSSVRGGCHQFSLDEIKSGTNDFSGKNFLGRGLIATVYLANIYVGRGNVRTPVVVKRLIEPCSSDFVREINTFSNIKHPNIVSLIGYCEESVEKILLYEYMPNGTLFDYLQEGSAVSLSWQQCLKICLGAARGLQRLHTETDDFPKGIIHRDVKPLTILLDENWVAKVSAFGMIKLSNAGQTNSALFTDIKGSIGYIAPEYVTSSRVTRKVDVYAFGWVLFEVLCRKLPPLDSNSLSFSSRDDENFGLYAQENVYRDIKHQISQDCLLAFTDVIGKCLLVDPIKRPTMDDVVTGLENSLKCQDAWSSSKQNFYWHLSFLRLFQRK